MTRPEILMPAPMHSSVAVTLNAHFILHRLWEQADPDAFLATVGPRIRGLAASTLAGRIDARWFDRAEAMLLLKRTHPDGLTGPHPFAIAHHLLGRWLQPE